MKSIAVSAVSFLFIFIVFIDNSFGWGFQSHRNIHTAAIDGMPAAIKPFFEKHRNFLIEESVTPDRRRRHDPTEGPNHYINLDLFGDYPFENFPLEYKNAVNQFGEDSLQSKGLAVWRVANWYDSLTVAMAEQDVDKILRFAADLGHYIADLHMPLHTTSHYDGQLTNQRGVHRRFETDLPERYDSRYCWKIPEVRLIEDPLQYTFEFTLESYRLIDELYTADMKARDGIPENDLYTIERRNDRRIYIYNDKYYEQFHKELNGMVEDRLRLATQRIRDLWYTAWVRAGKPELL